VGTIGAAVLMAAAGARWQGLPDRPLLFVAWWAAVAVFLGLSVIVALLDIRYIRLRYLLEKRQAFLETLGDRQLRESLRDVLRETEQNGDGGPEEPPGC